MVVTEYITIAGDPMLAPKFVIKLVSILGFFLPRKYPIPITKKLEKLLQIILKITPY